jgi:hypothetical protein
MGRSGRSPEAGAPAPGRREHPAAESGRLADEREHEADERDQLADERERAADERERLADEREQEADEREQLAEHREKRLDELAREVALLVADRHARAQQAIERSDAKVAATRERLDRSEAALLRSEASAVRAQAQIDRTAAQGEREPANQPPDADVPAELVTVLRRRLSVRAASLATGFEELAQAYEELTARDPPQDDEHRGNAEAARKAAHQVGEIGRRFSS